MITFVKWVHIIQGYQRKEKMSSNIKVKFIPGNMSATKIHVRQVQVILACRYIHFYTQIGGRKTRFLICITIVPLLAHRDAKGRIH